MFRPNIKRKNPQDDPTSHIPKESTKAESKEAPPSHNPGLFQKPETDNTSLTAGNRTPLYPNPQDQENKFKELIRHLLKEYKLAEPNDFEKKLKPINNGYAFELPAEIGGGGIFTRTYSDNGITYSFKSDKNNLEAQFDALALALAFENKDNDNLEIKNFTPKTEQARELLIKALTKVGFTNFSVPEIEKPQEQQKRDMSLAPK